MTTNEEKTTCQSHPKVETALRCATCGTLICPKCLVQTAVGCKCRDCAYQRNSPLYQLSLLQAVCASVVALAAGAFAGWAVEFSVGLFTLFLAVIYGGFAGDMALRATVRKRGVKMQIIMGVGIGVGALGGRLLVAAILLSSSAQLHPPNGVWDVVISMLNPFEILVIALVIGSAVSKIKYL